MKENAMKTMTRFLALALMAGLFLVSGLSAQDATEIMKKSHMTYYYAGDDGVAEVKMTLVGSNGKERVREFTMLRLDVEDGGNQMYYTYFKSPSDVARTSFMVHKTADGNDKRWIYVPAVDLVRPISADDKNSSFVGSDFTYEDVSGRHWNEDTHTVQGEGEVDGKAVWIIQSVPKDEGYDGFARKVSYIDKESTLPLKEEYFNDKDEMIRRFTAQKIEDADGFITMTTRKMENLEKGSYTIVDFSSIDYNVGLTKDIFTERYLKNPPRQFIR
jgi:outer membrane lipoprotein-sorting protein